MQVSELTRWLDTDNFKQFTLEDLGGWPSVEAPLEQIQMPVGKPFIAHYLQNVSASMIGFSEWQSEAFGKDWTKYNVRPEARQAITQQLHHMQKELKECLQAFKALHGKYDPNCQCTHGSQYGKT